MSTEKHYIQAFNNGYTLAEYEPRLLNTISKNLTPSNMYLNGLLDGKDQFEFEKDKIILDKLSQLRNETSGRNNDLYRER